MSITDLVLQKNGIVEKGVEKISSAMFTRVECRLLLENAENWRGETSCYFKTTNGISGRLVDAII